MAKYKRPTITAIKQRMVTLAEQCDYYSRCLMSDEEADKDVKLAYEREFLTALHKFNELKYLIGADDDMTEHWLPK